MTDTRQQADAIEFHIEQNTTAATGCQVTSVTQCSDGVYIEVSGDPSDFDGDVYVRVGGTKVKQSTFERMKRRERQKARQSAAISDAEKEARREAQHQEWQARQERQRKENERRWEERDRKEGRKLSKAEHLARDLEEEKEKASRKKSRPLTSFFKPVVHGSQDVDCSAHEADGSGEDVLADDAHERVEERNAHEEHCSGKGSAFTRGMEVFLRLAFIDSEQVDSMMLKEAKKYIREKGIIGKVTIEEMVERDVARLNLVEFGKLRDYSKRSAGVDVNATLFSKLKEALNKIDGKVNTKYLTKQNRQSGENHKWTDTQIEQVRKAVEEAKQRWPDSLYSKAAEFLRTRYNGPILGNISNQQVRNVYEQKVLKSNAPRAPVGRPRKKSSQAASS